MHLVLNSTKQVWNTSETIIQVSVLEKKRNKMIEKSGECYPSNSYQ